VAARDISAGSQLTSDALATTRLSLQSSHAWLFTRQQEASLNGLRATHDLISGQLIQRSDVAPVQSPDDRRIVFVPVKDAPPIAPGSLVDLMLITGGPDHPTVQPFAQAVEVMSSTAAGLVLVVPAEKVAAFVYAGAAMQLAAVVAQPGSAIGVEVPISTDQQAIDVAGQP